MIRFVGAGPGDPELITVRGARLLSEADLVVYAGSLVDRELVKRYAPRAQVWDSSGMTLDQVIQVMADAHAAGRRVVRLHTGDPTVYGAIGEQMENLDALGIPYEVVPGVTSGLAAAAILRRELTLPELSQSVVITRLEGRTPVPSGEPIEAFASTSATLLVYLSVGMIDRLAERLIAGGRSPDTPVAVVSKVSWPDQEVVTGTLADIAGLVREREISRQAVVIVGDVLAVPRGGVTPSRLYAADFTHGFRG